MAGGPLADFQDQALEPPEEKMASALHEIGRG